MTTLEKFMRFLAEKNYYISEEMVEYYWDLKYEDEQRLESNSGDAYINTTSVNASAILQADSTTKGFLPPKMTTTQKNEIDTPAAGLVMYDTTLQLDAQNQQKMSDKSE